MTSDPAPDALQPITLDAIEAARLRIADAVVMSPCGESFALSQLVGCRLFCKLDYLQRTGSFKERGAANALMLLDPALHSRGVVAASAGNHALALAYHGQRLGIPVTVVMPQYAPLIKVETCRRFGASVVNHGESFVEARDHAERLVAQRGLTYVHGYDDPHVIAGQGTLGLEILEQVPELEAVVVPVGGAGLIAGMAVAIKALRPSVQVIGVEAARMPTYTASLEAGHPVLIEPQLTLADGLAVGRVGRNAFAASRGLIDRVVTVDEGELSLAVLRLLEMEKAVVEGAAAAPLAALMSGRLPELAGKVVAIPLCGGNIDPFTLHRVIEYGMAVDGRLHRFTVAISDRPGGLAQLTRIIADAGASIQEIRHDRMFAGPDVARVQVHIVIETRNSEHYQQMMARLSSNQFEPLWDPEPITHQRSAS